MVGMAGRRMKRSATAKRPFSAVEKAILSGVFD
jgi:hypothetical protein